MKVREAETMSNEQLAMCNEFAEGNFYGQIHDCQAENNGYYHRNISDNFGDNRIYHDIQPEI